MTNEPESQKHRDCSSGDPRSIDELFAVALSHADEQVVWNAIGILHSWGTADVLARAEKLCRSRDANERRVGVDILGQLGVPDRTFPQECLSILLRMLDKEVEADVLNAILIALGHLKDSAPIEPALRYRGHPNADVRFGVVFALVGHDDQRAMDCLIELSGDETPHVRDWATFGLSQLTASDTPAIRDALIARLNDADHEIRSEAMLGLAMRGDDRAVPAIRRELASNCLGSLVLQAAEATGDVQLYREVAEAAQAMIDVSPPEECNGIPRDLRP